MRRYRVRSRRRLQHEVQTSSNPFCTIPPHPSPQDTVRTFSNIIVFIQRAKQHFQPKSYQLDLVQCIHVHVHVLGCGVLLCFVVCLTLLASFFLPSASLINMYNYYYKYKDTHSCFVLQVLKQNEQMLSILAMLLTLSPQVHCPPYTIHCALCTGTLSTVHCTMHRYTVHRTLHYVQVHCPPYTALCTGTLSTVHCTMHRYTVHRTLHYAQVHCPPYTALCTGTLSTVHCPPYTALCTGTLSTVHCTMYRYTVHRTLHYVQVHCPPYTALCTPLHCAVV